ncbi:hypothetical protein LCGC14_0534580 [marine sediment metagenome]|uniref:Uncharacterized protein n=1 Tax=marine sediment metagenome TaxID=412755 RepID=A0A0F9SCY1_9ZZZZ
MKSKEEIKQDVIEAWKLSNYGGLVFDPVTELAVDLAISKTEDNERQNFAEFLEEWVKIGDEKESFDIDKIKAKIKDLKK